MPRFRNHTTITGIFKIRGRKVHLDNVTLEWPEAEPECAIAIMALHRRHKKGGYIDISDKAIEALNDANDFTRYAHDIERQIRQYSRDLQDLNREYLAERGV